MKEKKLLIVERCDNSLQHIEEGNDSIVLKGVFTTFNVKNRNGRVYESSDFLPHVENLKSVIESGSLLGELDHPHTFETTLANASHVVESLEYDPQQNAVIGKIRLLNTSKGKDAQALVRDGIPLHISSRAAGTVDESGRVRLQQLFTYDLVAEPGFANAVLTRVNEGVDQNPISDESRRALQAMNESYNYINENCKKVIDDGYFEAYELSEDLNTDLAPENAKGGTSVPNFAPEQAELNNNTASTSMVIPGQDNTNNNNNNMEDKGQYILYSDFQKYSEHLSEVISDLQSAIANYKSELAKIKVSGDPTRPSQQYDSNNVDNSMIADLVAKEVESKVACAGNAECVIDDVEAIRSKTDSMEEKYDALMQYTKYLAETLDRSISYQNYVSEESNKIIAHNNYLAENMNKMIAHQDYLAENLNDTISYQNYLAESLDSAIDYESYLAENLDNSMKYQDYLAENLDNSMKYQDYLAESLDKSMQYQDYIAENLDKSISHQDYLVEKFNEIGTNVIEETNSVENAPAEPAAEPAADTVNNFNHKLYQDAISEKLNNLISTVKSQYNEIKDAERRAVEESKNKINQKDFSLINYIPARLMERWSNLSDDRKKEILSESKLFVINNAETAEYFWNTRDLRESKVENQVEKSIAAPAQPLNENVLNDDRMKMMAEEIKWRMRK